MLRSRCLALLATACLAPLAPAQTPSLGDVNFFGEDLAKKVTNEGRGRFFNPTEQAKKEKADGFQHTLVFQNGRQFRGELVEVTKDEIVWKRPDARAALRFPRGEIRRVTLTEEAAPTNSFSIVNQRRTGTKEDPKAASRPATIKLPGGDWLFGNALSADGQTFGLDLGANANLTVGRECIEWLHFGQNPAPAFGFAGNALSMDGWLPSSADMTTEGGVLKVESAPWIGRSISPPERFEVAFEVPAESEETLRLWLQPFGPQVNCYGTGTVELRFGRKELSRLIYFDKFERKSTPLSAESQAEQGPVSYRILYDGIDQRLIVMRNGREIGNWSFAKKEDANAPAGNRGTREYRINAICFDREQRGGDVPPLKFRQLRIQPWDGAPIKAGTTLPPGDRLSSKGAETIAGQLESISEKELSFSGSVKPREEATQVRLNPPITSMADADTLVSLGKQGEFCAAEVEVRDGMVRARTIFAPRLELPVSTLSSLNFSKQKEAQEARTDVLVFKNCDEFPGTLLGAEKGGVLRWRASSGQEVEFEPGRIAGVRFTAVEKSAKPAGATIELSNGDLLRGELLALDVERLQLRHPQLGELSIPRSRIARIFPPSKSEIREGSRDSESWLLATQNRREKSSDARSWVYLDGVFVLRAAGTGNSYGGNDMKGLSQSIGSDLERFEVRGEVTFVNGGYGNSSLQVSSKEGGSMQASFSLDEVQIIAYGPRGQQPNWKTITFRDKIGEITTRLAVRLFVDTKAGRTDLYINGVPIARTGQTPADRMTGPCNLVSFQSYTGGGVPAVFSNLWIGPWTGELPRAGAEPGAITVLANGDTTPGTPKELRDGRFSIDSELGPLDLPQEKVHSVDFATAAEPEKAAARLRLVDGGALHVDAFRWDGQEITAHSVTLGDLRIPAKALSELVYDPAPMRPPIVAAPKKLTQQTAPKPLP